MRHFSLAGSRVRRTLRRRRPAPAVVALAALALSGCAGSVPPPAAAASPLPCLLGVSHSVRTALPGVRLHCLDGTGTVTLARLPRRPVLVNLWASWCGPCRQEMPLLARLARAEGSRVLILGVDTQDTRAAARRFLGTFGASYPELSDPSGRLLRALGSPGLPTTLGLDAGGRIFYRTVGALTPQTLRAALAAIGAPSGRTSYYSKS